MFYYLYKITNLVNNKIYVGVHKTHDMNDGYMGSGKVIKRAIEKYGTGNFRKDILEAFQDAKSMYAREKELVTEEFLSREDVYNLRRGGQGGFDYINKNKLNGFSDVEVAKKAREKTNEILESRYGSNWKTEISKLANKARQKKYVNDKLYKEKMVESVSNARKYAFSKEANLKRKNTLKKLFSNSNHQVGKNNSNYGTMWITNGKDNKKIKKDCLIPKGYNKGRVIKKV
jgi:hypothetical protein